jgi:hypothetical protein
MQIPSWLLDWGKGAGALWLLSTIIHTMPEPVNPAVTTGQKLYLWLYNIMHTIGANWSKLQFNSALPKIGTLLLIMLLFCGVAQAQTPAPAPAPAPAPVTTYPATVIGFGASYDNIAKPGVTASLLQAKLLTAPTAAQPVYSFTIEDFSPVKDSTGKTNWQSAVTTGAASLLRSLGSLGNLWAVGTVGGGFTGSTSGLAWSAGGAWTHKISGSLLTEVDLRTLKVANASNQARIGLKLCWGSK